MTNRFENLSNELLLEIFGYINPWHLYDAFGNINSRLNHLLAMIDYLRIVINEKENNELLNTLAPHVIFLKINTWSEIDLSKFYNLHSIIMIRPSPMQLKQIQADTMPKLTYLSLFSNVHFFPPPQLIHDVFSKRFYLLRWARLGQIDSLDFVSELQSLSLRYLHVGCCHTTVIPVILRTCPNLEQLHVDILRSENIAKTTPISVSSHPLQRLILRDYCCVLSYEDIKALIPYVAYVKKIELRFHCNTSFVALLQYLANTLSQLCKFDCYVTESPIDFRTDLTTIHQIHECFNRIICRTPTTSFRIFKTT